MSVDNSISRVTRGNRFSRERIYDTDNQSSASVERNKGAKNAPLFRHKPLKGKVKLILVSFGLIGIVCLVMFVYLSTCYVDPNYLNVGAYLNRSYSRDTLRNIIETEKMYLQYEKDLQESLNNNLDVEVDKSIAATPLSRNGLSDEIYSKDSYYIDGFAEINNYLLKYCSKYGSFTAKLGTSEIKADGLYYMAMANTESGGWCADFSKTVSSAFPSAFIDISGDNYEKRIQNVNIYNVLISPDSYDPTIYGYTFTGKPWIGDPLTQGPATQWFSSTSGIDTASEHSKIEGDSAKSEILKAMLVSDTYRGNETSAQLLYEKIFNECTGSGFSYSNGAVGDNGDRWCIADACTVFAKAQESAVNSLNKVYPVTESCTDYELVALLRMNHWMSGVATSTYEQYTTNKENKVQFWYENWNHYQSWIAYAKALSTEEVISEFRSIAKENIDKHYFIVDGIDFSSIYEKVNEQKLVYNNGHESFTFSIEDECLSSQAKTEFVLFLYRYILLETMYSGGATE